MTSTATSEMGVTSFVDSEDFSPGNLDHPVSKAGIWNSVVYHHTCPYPDFVCSYGPVNVPGIDPATFPGPDLYHDPDGMTPGLAGVDVNALVIDHVTFVVYLGVVILHSHQGVEVFSGV